VVTQKEFRSVMEPGLVSGIAACGPFVGTS
jgi:hypothetical protein